MLAFAGLQSFSSSTEMWNTVTKAYEILDFSERLIERIDTSTVVNNF